MMAQPKKIKGLKCKECERLYEAKALHVCEFCFGPLEADYNYDLLAKNVTRKKIEAGPLSLWRYWDLLPVESKNIISLQEGFTPLVHAKNLGRILGLKNLYIKNDTVNPTFSFKDRVVSVALTRAKELGFETVACASTGNLAGAVSAYGASSNLRRFVFIPADLEEGKIIGAGVYNPIIVAIEGNYDEVNRLCAEVADTYKWAFVNVNIRPYYAEGSKTLGYEVAEQLGWKAPDQVVVPAASGSLLTKIYKGFKEFEDLGLISKHKTILNCAQAQGCGPISQAVLENTDIIKPVRPKTIAKSLAIGNPADGVYAAKIVQKTGGKGVLVSDEEIVEGIKLLASTEGIFSETAGGVTIASLKHLVQTGSIASDDVTVAFVTGNGLKTMDAVQGKVSRPHVIPAQLQEFRKLYERLQTDSSAKVATEAVKN
ncbi:threonine synthase [bacterium F11]|nr:threonine synthase [bacterium F11]